MYRHRAKLDFEAAVDLCGGELPPRECTIVHVVSVMFVQFQREWDLSPFTLRAFFDAVLD
eukprot:2771821-Lingulodinium_polyedra.AAC.1